MNKNIFLSSLLCGLCFSTFTSANDKVDKVYDSQRYKQVCKGKTQGAPVSFAYRGIIWNGTCEPHFFPSNKAMMVDEHTPALSRLCQNDLSATSINLEGKEIKGKCALSFSPPQPKM